VLPSASPSTRYHRPVTTDEDWTAPCGDRFSLRGDALSLRAAEPVPDLEPSAHRKPVLVVRDARFTLVSAARDGGEHVYALVREEPNAFAPPGKTVEYDEDRHLALRTARRRQTAAWALYVVLVPFAPLIGLLPSRWKDALQDLGVGMSAATGMSIPLQGVLVWPTVFLFWLTIVAQAPWTFVVVAGTLALSLGFDVVYRLSGLDEDPPVARGVFSWLPGLVRFFVRAGARPLRRRRRPAPAPPPRRADDSLPP
jgi:hypothetical protein